MRREGCYLNACECKVNGTFIPIKVLWVGSG